MVRVTVGQTSQTTVSKLRTERPVYEQGFTFLVHNPEIDTIEFKVCILSCFYVGLTKYIKILNLYKYKMK